MKAVEYDRYGPASVLSAREVPRPRPGPGEILVRVRAAALNPKDVLVRAGKFSLVTGRRFPNGLGKCNNPKQQATASKLRLSYGRASASASIKLMSLKRALASLTIASEKSIASTDAPCDAASPAK
jgi:hypothetical protein